MANFASLKKSSGSSLDKLTKAVEAMASNNQNDDSSEFWKPALDKSGNSFNIIRFLPTPPQDVEADGLPWIKYFDHGFQGPTGLWYIEKSLSTIGQKDAVGEFNSELWNSGIEANKEQARKQKRRLHYVANIYVVKDGANPDNNGKVFKFTFGKKIFEKIMGAMKPQFEDETAIDPFDLWQGANFKLKIRKVDGYQNYDLSEWDSPSALLEDDDELEKVWKSQYSLLDIIDPKNFKSPAELEARLKRVLGIDQPKTKFKTAEESTKARLEEDEIPSKELSPKPQKSVVIEDDEEESDLAYFESLIGD